MTITKNELDKLLDKTYRGISYFREHKDELSLEQYKKYNEKFCVTVEEILDNLTGRLTIKDIEEIFPEARIVDEKPES